MEDNEFKKSLKATETVSQTQRFPISDTFTEALYKYTNNSLEEIFEFLLNFYQDNPTQDMIESDHIKSSHAENYYYSLMYELSHAHTNFLNSNSNMQNFEEQFNKICSQYNTNPLEIYKTYDLIVQAKEDLERTSHKDLVDNIEAEVDEHWKKIKENKQDRGNRSY